jgi:hypothetical protein
MDDTVFHRLFKPVKRYTPFFIHAFLHNIGTAAITPLLSGWRTGFFLSCFKNRAVDRNGRPIPWYTYPAIDFLRSKDFRTRSVLELGGGQSTLWWAERCRKVVSFESDKKWYEELRNKVPANTELHHLNAASAEELILKAEHILKEGGHDKFDIVVIDGQWRFEVCGMAKRCADSGGAIIADDSEGYGLAEAFENDTEFQKVDFWGNAAGITLERCTSIFFRKGCFLFSCRDKIPASLYT